jgi:hypothetical protein
MSNQSINVTFEKVQTGVFNVLADGVKTKYEIVNGCAGLSGRDTANIYGIVNGSKVAWVGSIQSAKRMITMRIKKFGPNGPTK